MLCFGTYRNFLHIWKQTIANCFIERLTMSEIRVLNSGYTVRSALKLMGKFCPHPKFAQREKTREKDFCFFFLLCPQKGKQARSTGNARPAEGWLKSEHRDC